MNHAFPSTTPIGFLGIGVMGQPMSLNLAKAGTPLLVWNRSVERTKPVAEAGAEVAASVDDLFQRTATVIMMLVTEQVTDDVLGRGTEAFAHRVAGHLIVSTGSTSPEYSRRLAAEVREAGGRFVEAPVSGSRLPAEAGELVALLGAEAGDVDEVRALLQPMCRSIIHCGPVGHGLLMKLAVNLYLDVSIAALAESVHFASGNGLDLSILQTALNGGQLASDITRAKLPKLVAGDFAVQAATQDGFTNTQLIAEAAAAGVATPLLGLAGELYGEAVDPGNARLDMSSVLHAIEARDASAR